MAQTTEVFSITTGSDGSYEWAEFHVYRHPAENDKFASWSDAGCSCNSYTGPTSEELAAEKPESRAHMRTLMLAFLRDHSYIYSTGDLVVALDRFERTDWA